MKKIDLPIEAIKNGVIFDYKGQNIYVAETNTKDQNLSELEENVKKELGDNAQKILFKHYFIKNHDGSIEEQPLFWSLDWHERMQRPGNLITVNTLTPDSPFITRLWTYLNERFEPIPYLFAFSLMTFALAQSFRALTGLAWDFSLIASTVLFSLMQFFFFLLLRVFDEHKDWDTDHINFPERVLSLGLVNLKHMKLMGYFSVIFFYIGSLFFGMTHLIFTSILFIYSLLMLKEFFIADWLKERMFLYGITHNFIITLCILWVFFGLAMISGKTDPLFKMSYLWIALFINGMFFSIEVARKIRLPEFEKDDVDTYSQVIGYKNSCYLALFVQILAFIALFFAGLPLGLISWAVMGFGYLVVFGLFMKFLKDPTEEAAEKLINPATLTYMISLFTISIGLW